MFKGFSLLETYQAVVGRLDANPLYHIFDAAYHLLKVIFSFLPSGIKNEAKFQICRCEKNLMTQECLQTSFFPCMLMHKADHLNAKHAVLLFVEYYRILE